VTAEAGRIGKRGPMDTKANCPGWIGRVCSIAATLALFGISSTAVAADKVVVGVIGSLSDAPFYLSIDNGYFAEAGIEPQLEAIPSLAKQVAPLSAGELDVASGAMAAGLYNAVSRGIPMKIVADKGRNAPGYGFNAIMVRKDLYDDGTIRSLKDLKGRTIATIGTGSADVSVLNEAMRSVGLGYDDLTQTELALPNHLTALENKALPLTLTPEPFATMMIDRKVAVKLATVDQFYPDQQQTVLIYGGKFIAERPEVARRFMTAFLRGLRAYLAGLEDGRIAGPNADAVVASLIKHSRFKDAGLLRRIVPAAMDPDGQVNAAGIEKDWALLKQKGFIQATVTPQELIDMSFAAQAARALGPFKTP
jgi:NitT/TauT family transport system substrate-binding protein